MKTDKEKERKASERSLNSEGDANLELKRCPWTDSNRLKNPVYMPILKKGKMLVAFSILVTVF